MSKETHLEILTPFTGSNLNILTSAARKSLISNTASRYPTHMCAPSAKLSRLFHPDNVACGVKEPWLLANSSQREGLKTLPSNPHTLGRVLLATREMKIVY